jgi:hypothetical protein
VDEDRVDVGGRAVRGLGAFTGTWSFGMNLEDLKLLVDVAWHERHGQKGFTVGRGFGKACDRLVKSGLLVRNPTRRKNAQVSLAVPAANNIIQRMEELEP